MSNFASSGTSGPLLYLDYNGATDEIRLTDLGDAGEAGQHLDGAERPTTARRALRPGPLDGERQGDHHGRRAVRPAAAVLHRRQAGSDPDRLLLGADLPAARRCSPATTSRRGIGVSYDPAGDGKTAIKAFYGRYYYNFADSFSAVDPGGANSKTYKFNDLNGNRLYDGPQELGSAAQRDGRRRARRSTPGIKTPHTDEFDLSYQRQFWGESSFRVAYVRKMTREQASPPTTSSRAGQFTVPVTVPVTLQSIDQGVTGTQNFTVYRHPELAQGRSSTTSSRRCRPSVNNGAYNYDTIELAFNKRFQQGLFLDTSFDWTRRDDLRNNSASNNPLTQSDPISNGYYQNVYPTVANRQKTSTWEFHLSSRYELPYQIGVGANFQVQSGWQYARRITVEPAERRHAALLDDRTSATTGRTRCRC